MNKSFIAFAMALTLASTSSNLLSSATRITNIENPILKGCPIGPVRRSSVYIENKTNMPLNITVKGGFSDDSMDAVDMNDAGIGRQYCPNANTKVTIPAYSKKGILTFARGKLTQAANVGNKILQSALSALPQVAKGTALATQYYSQPATAATAQAQANAIETSAAQQGISKSDLAAQGVTLAVEALANMITTGMSTADIGESTFFFYTEVLTLNDAEKTEIHLKQLRTDTPKKEDVLIGIVDPEYPEAPIMGNAGSITVDKYTIRFKFEGAGIYKNALYTIEQR